MDQRFQARMTTAAADVSAPAADRKRAVDSLPVMRPQNESLAFASTWFGGRGEPEKIVYLMENLARFAYLAH